MVERRLCVKVDVFDPDMVDTEDMATCVVMKFSEIVVEYEDNDDITASYEVDTLLDADVESVDNAICIVI